MGKFLSYQSIAEEYTSITVLPKVNVHVFVAPAKKSCMPKLAPTSGPKTAIASHQSTRPM